MTTDATLAGTLEALGARPVPALAPDAAARLDERISALTGTPVSAPPAERSSAGVVVQLPQRRHHRARTIAVVGAAVAVAAVLAAGVLAGSPTGWFDTGSDPDLALASAKNAVVHLPDGSSITAHVGLSLPDGAIVTTGPGGYVTAGGVELGPGGEAVVSGGELEPSVSVPSVSTPIPPSLPPTVPAGPLP